MERTPFAFDRSGSHVALDLANTVSGRLTGRPIEHLADWQALVDFAEQTGLVGPGDVEAWRGLEARDPAEAERVLASVRALRDAIYAVFAAVTHGAEPPAAALAVINRWSACMELGPDLTWRCSADRGPYEGAFMPLLRQAIDLLVSDQRARVRECDADDCAWLFLDTSKNRSRRWCDMKSCGNRAKARRFQARHEHGAARDA